MGLDQPQKHAVFLSFRGSDTRNSFISHLDEALRRQGIPTFLDSKEFPRGSEISEILNEIESSNVSIVIFSENYADSPWCLDELVQIMKCKETKRQEVVPVFYHVDPSHVESRSGSYGVAIAKHEKDPENKVKVPNWTTLLRQAANLSGWPINKDRPEAELINEIVEDILQKLKPLYSSPGLEGLVGIHDKIREVEALLQIGRVDNRRVVGIWGMGGVGKTTLAQVVFNRCSFHFDAACFLHSVRERSIIELQRDLMFEIFGGNCTTGMMKQQLRHKRVLIVLDDVDKFLLFKGIIENLNLLGAGSRIIVTSRDKNVLENVADQGCMYKVPTLGDNEALELFSLAAEKEKFPSSSHLPLAKSFVKYAGGNPLAITVLGSFLYKKDIEEWKSALLKLKTNPNLNILEVLRISYDGLDQDEKQIFLNIACFLNRRRICEVESILGAFGLHTIIGLRNLEDKSLVDKSDGRVDMHDLLVELGKQLVREECVEEPGKRSRLFDPEDVIHVLRKNTGTESVEAISWRQYLRLSLDPTVFMNMTRLKFLELSGSPVEFPEGLEYLSNELRYLQWRHCPLKSLPSNFAANNLVELNMAYSNIQRFGKGVQDMPNLKRMDLSWCTRLIEMPDLSKAPKLEELFCRRCDSLEEVSPSISQLSKVKKLDFEGCKKIRSFPSTVSMMYLNELLLRDCPNLKMFPEVSRKIKSLDFDLAGIEEIPLETFRGLSSLEELNLRGCERLGSLPSNLDCLSSLRELFLSGSSIESIPKSIIQLSQLQCLYIPNCKRLRCLPELPSSVCVLWAEGCESLQNVSIPRHTHFGLLERLKWLRNRGNYGYMLEFRLPDCIELDESACEKIFAYAQQSITSVVAPILNKFLEDEDDDWIWGRTVTRFDVAGNEMPDWIEHRSGGGEGSSITIPFQPLNLLGFIFCAVFDFQPFGHRTGEVLDPLDSYFTAKFEVRLNSNYRRGRHESGPTARDTFPVVKSLSQNVFLGYLPCVTDDYEADSQYSELSATMEVPIKQGYIGPWPGVKWGLSLVYKDGDDEKEHSNDKGKMIACEENADDEEEGRPSKKRKS